jgi:hypothetical protein
VRSEVRLAAQASGLVGKTDANASGTVRWPNFAALSFFDWKPPQLPKLPKLPDFFWVILSPPGHPDKKRLMTVQDFYKYTEEEGACFSAEPPFK